MSPPPHSYGPDPRCRPGRCPLNRHLQDISALIQGCDLSITSSPDQRVPPELQLPVQWPEGSSPMLWLSLLPDYVQSLPVSHAFNFEFYFLVIFSGCLT